MSDNGGQVILSALERSVKKKAAEGLEFLQENKFGFLVEAMIPRP